MTSAMRSSIVRALLWIPAVLATIWFVNQERLEYLGARTQVESQARRAALAEGQLIQLRLMTQFRQLEFAAKAIVGDRDPDALGPRSRSLLDRFAAQHPELFALNIQSADGRRIVWSSHPQPNKPIFLSLDFTPLPGSPDFWIGHARYAPRYGAAILAMRYRMRDASGRTLYFVGSPYRVGALLATAQPGPWTISVRDLRDNSQVGTLRAGPAGPAPALAGRAEEPIAGLPLAVSAAWPSAMVWRIYAANLPWRLAGRTAVLAFFILAAIIIGRLLGSRERLLRQSARVARLNALLAHANQAILQANDAAAMQRDICQLIVRDPAIAVAWIGRPEQDEDARFELLAAARRQDGDGRDPAFGDDPAFPDDRRLAAAAWREGRAAFTGSADGATGSGTMPDRPHGAGIAATACLPLRRADAIWAILCLRGAAGDTFDPDLQRTVQELADNLSNGYDRIDLMHSQMVLQRQYASLLDNTVAGVVMVRSPGAIIVEANTAIARIFGVHNVRDVLGRNVIEAASTLGQAAMIEATRTALKEGRATLDALDIIRVDGQPACITLSGRRIDNDRDSDGYTDVVWTVVDVTEHQNLVRRMERLSQVDPLTGLPNRRALELNLERAIARATRIGAAVAVGMIDLDDFKPVNDRWGHDVGDALLRKLGDRLAALVRASDMIARLGGDEFVVVIEDLDIDHAGAQLRVILNRLHQAVESAFDLGGGRTATVGMSMGLALAPADGTSADTLLRLADGAMYQIKARKGTRSQWWTLAGTDQADDVPDPPFDPFATDAQALLTRVAPVFELVEREFVDSFYHELELRSDTAAILAALGSTHLARLKSSQMDHVHFLLEPTTSAARIQARAHHLGKVHALVGVAPSWLTASMQMYRDLLHWHLDASELVTRDRYRLQRILDARIQIDLQSQLDAMLEVQNAYNAYLARPLPRAGQDWTAVIQAKLRALGALPGIQACALLRPDARGLFRVLGSSGPRGEDVARILSSAEMQPSLDANAATGGGLAAVAWRTERIMTAKGYETTPGLAPWEQVAAQLGIRSMAAAPLLRAGQTDSVLVIYGAYPNQFDTQQGLTFLAALQNRWNLVDDLLRKRQPAVDRNDAALYRQWLYADGLRMDVQPVVDLNDGQVVKVEALARLVSPDGRVVPPATFLPALREADLDALFRLGLSQSLLWHTRWRNQGIDVDIALNLPPSTMLNPDCAQWVEEALRAHAVAPRHLVLELLESQEIDESLRDEAVATLGRLGVRLAIDDLGSGFSSLKRLASLPFDVIKIDRDIILDIDRDPVKALSLVRTVVQIGRDFEKEVVVEGVENAAIVEAVTILGATFGQGFGIARPMPADEFPHWVARYAQAQRAGRGGSPDRPLASPLGALAFHWLYMHEVQPHHDQPLHHCPLTVFLRGYGAEGREPMAWHRIVHETPNADERKAASQKLTAWLVERVRMACAPAAAEPSPLADVGLAGDAGPA